MIGVMEYWFAPVQPMLTLDAINGGRTFLSAKRVRKPALPFRSQNVLQNPTAIIALRDTNTGLF
jgi:hypothetical protein